MCKILTILFFIFTANAYSIDLKLKGRSIPAHCIYVYYIQTDFHFTLPLKSQSPKTVQIQFEDAYTKTFGEKIELSLKKSKSNYEVYKTFETMKHSTHQLNNKMKVYYNDLEYLVDFSFLMNRCSKLGRKGTPYKPIELELKSFF